MDTFAPPVDAILACRSVDHSIGGRRPGWPLVSTSLDGKYLDPALFQGCTFRPLRSEMGDTLLQ